MIRVRDGMDVIVDDDVAPVVANKRWSERRGHLVWWDGKRNVPLSHLVISPPPGYEVDHINRNPLDNRRVNLRVCTHSQNMLNRRSKGGKLSGFRGVECIGRSWRAVIYINRKRYSLGRFATPEDAARAYDSKARELHGEFAVLNFQ